MKNLLQIKNLNVKLFTEGGILPVIDNVSMELSEGQVIGIVGESGCGKSTLAKSVIRLTEPAAGEIILNNKDFRKLKGRELKETYKRRYGVMLKIAKY